MPCIATGKAIPRGPTLLSLRLAHGSLTEIAPRVHVRSILQKHTHYIGQPEENGNMQWRELSGCLQPTLLAVADRRPQTAGLAPLSDWIDHHGRPRSFPHFWLIQLLPPVITKTNRVFHFPTAALTSPLDETILGTLAPATRSRFLFQLPYD